MLTCKQFIGCARVHIVILVVSLAVTNIVDRFNDRLTDIFVDAKLRYQLNGDFAATTIRGRCPYDRLGPDRRLEILYVHYLDLPLGLSGQVLYYRCRLWSASDILYEYIPRAHL